MNITLTCGLVMQVDPEDAPLAQAYAWQVRRHPGQRSLGYVMRIVRENGHRRSVFFHREITQAPKGLLVDHRNGDTLNNQRSNLRLVTNSQNQQNQHGARADSRTGYRGVSLTPSGKYRARIWLRGQRSAISLGTFLSKDAAASAAAAARQYLMTHAPECEARS